MPPGRARARHTTGGARRSSRRGASAAKLAGAGRPVWRRSPSRRSSALSRRPVSRAASRASARYASRSAGSSARRCDSTVPRSPRSTGPVSASAGPSRNALSSDAWTSGRERRERARRTTRRAVRPDRRARRGGSRRRPRPRDSACAPRPASVNGWSPSSSASAVTCGIAGDRRPRSGEPLETRPSSTGTTAAGASRRRARRAASRATGRRRRDRASPRRGRRAHRVRANAAAASAADSIARSGVATMTSSRVASDLGHELGARVEARDGRIRRCRVGRAARDRDDAPAQVDQREAERRAGPAGADQRDVATARRLLLANTRPRGRRRSRVRRKFQCYR